MHDTNYPPGVLQLGGRDEEFGRPGTGVRDQRRPGEPHSQLHPLFGPGLVTNSILFC